MSNVFNVYIPCKNTSLESSIKKGSAIVANGTDFNTIEIYYEGNLYNSSDLKSFENKLLHASDRMIMRYPTIARARVDINDVFPVGSWDYENKVFSLSPECISLFNEWSDSRYQVYSVSESGRSFQITSKYSQNQRCDFIRRIENAEIYQHQLSNVEGLRCLMIVKGPKPKDQKRVPLITMTDAQIDYSLGLS